MGCLKTECRTDFLRDRLPMNGKYKAAFGDVKMDCI